MSTQSPTPSELNSEYFRLKSDLRNLQIFVGIIGFLVIGFIVTISLHVRISVFLDIESEQALIIPLIQILIMIPLVFLTRRFQSSSDEKLFYKCYGLQKFLGTFLERKSNKFKQKAMNRASNLESYVDRWVITTAPNCMSEVSEKLSKHFDDLWWTLDDVELNPLEIQDKDKQNRRWNSLKIFNVNLNNFCVTIYKNPPSFEVLSDFTLSAFIDIEEKHYTPNTIKMKSFFEKIQSPVTRFFKNHPNTLFVMPFLVGLGTISGLHYVDPSREYDNLINGIYSILMTFAIVVPIWLVLKNYKLQK